MRHPRNRLPVALAILSLGSLAAHAGPGSETPAAEPLTFSEAVARALARNPAVAIADRDVQRAEGLLTETRAAWLPSLTANGAYTRLDDDRMLGGRVIAARDQLSANLLLSVPLIAPQRWVQSSHAHDDVDVARLGTADVRRTLAIAVARVYISVVTQHRLGDIAATARATAAAHETFTRRRFEAGQGSRLDALRASQEAASASAQQATTAWQIVRAQEALGVLVGADHPVDTAGVLALPTVKVDAADLVDERSDVRVARRLVAAADQVVQQDWTTYSPVLVGSLLPFLQRPGTPSTPDTGWQAQLQLTVPLFDGGVRRAQQRQHASALAKRHLALEGTVRQAQSDLRVAAAGLRQSQAALNAARQASHLADEALALSTLAYKEGATSNIEVIDAERRARDAATAATLAEDTLRQAELDVAIAAGHFPSR